MAAVSRHCPEAPTAPVSCNDAPEMLSGVRCPQPLPVVDKLIDVALLAATLMVTFSPETGVKSEASITKGTALVGSTICSVSSGLFTTASVNCPLVDPDELVAVTKYAVGDET